MRPRANLVLLWIAIGLGVLAIGFLLGSPTFDDRLPDGPVRVECDSLVRPRWVAGRRHPDPARRWQLQYVYADRGEAPGVSRDPAVRAAEDRFEAHCTTSRRTYLYGLVGSGLSCLLVVVILRRRSQ